MSAGDTPSAEPVEIFDTGGTPVGRGEFRDGTLVLNNRVVPSKYIDHLDMRGVHLRPDVRLGEHSDDTMPLGHQEEVIDRLDDRDRP
jgi:hypothetical protein